MAIFIRSKGLIQQSVHVLYSSTIEKIYNQLTSGQLKDGVILMNAAKETFPDLAVDKQQQHMETDSEEEKETETLDTLACLKNIFMGKKYCCTEMITKFMCGSRGGDRWSAPPPPLENHMLYGLYL